MWCVWMQTQLLPFLLLPTVEACLLHSASVATSILSVVVVIMITFAVLSFSVLKAW